ncbi:MAG TPA: tetratricopeptide repeat protein [Planctomycetota bacterium]|nr:tetratricopeptide repeat protein [Planctomycetota bacterium]
MDRIPDDPALGYVILPRPVTLPQSRLTAECVPESVCAVMNYWGKAASVEELSFYGRNSNFNGMLSTQVPLLARQKGFRATFVEGSVGRIKNAIDRGVPPIIGVEAGGGRYHCFVVIGYSDKEQTIVCEEYHDSKRLIPYDEIETLWQPAGHLMLELEISKAEEIFADAANLEAKGRYDEAASLYRRALKADESLYEARLGLGNCLFFQHQPEEALKEYLLAQKTNGADPRVCNNLANVYLELKREPAETERLAERAVEAYEAALQRAHKAVEQEGDATIRSVRQKVVRNAELDVADAMATLAQARVFNGKHELAIAAWKASIDHTPLTEFDVRAKRMAEIAFSCRALNMPAEARRHLDAALREARDPDLRARLEADRTK